jgi:Tfp pilus assembly major pilin PilA
MKLISIMILLVVGSSSTSARIQLYSRALAKKYVTDSLRTIDSSRVADSLMVAKHIEDSIMIARYRIVDNDLKNERIREKKALEAFKPITTDSSERIISDDVDDISARTIVIDENNKYSMVIDSLQKRTDSINNSIYDHDQWFKKMKTYSLSEKKRYMLYLIQNNLKDNAAVLNCCNLLYQTYSSKVDLLIAIRSSQTNNSKSFMTNQIEILKQRMAELSNFIVALSPKVPLLPQREDGQRLQ